MKTIVGLYDDIATARRVVEELAAAGFERGDISLVANNQTTGTTTTGATGGNGEAVAEGAAGGALVGGALGGLGGLLLGLGALAIPGIGPVVAAGPIVAGLTGAGIGAAVGGLTGALVNWGVPEAEAEFYAEGVRRGGTLVAVKSDESMVKEALAIMNRFGPVDVRERSGMWRSEGWTGFNADTTMDTTTTRATSSTAKMPSAARNVESEAAIPIVEEELHVGKREVEKGGVRVHSYLEEKPVQESVELREENVYVERRPVDRAVDASTIDAFQERTYEVRERAEEVVTDKQARVVEEVVVGKKVDTHVETVEDTVRRTRVEVEKMGNGNNYDTRFRSHFDQTYGNRGYTFDRYQPAYTYGAGLSHEQRFHGRDWTSIEADVRRDWESRNSGPWEEFKDAVRYGWENVKDAVRDMG
jgi:uncharacterized protein (TIGR02271 family)